MQVSTQLVAHTRTVSSTGAGTGKEHVVLIHAAAAAAAAAAVVVVVVGSSR
jgi:hypothetical protein